VDHEPIKHKEPAHFKYLNDQALRNLNFRYRPDNNRKDLCDTTQIRLESAAFAREICSLFSTRYAPSPEQGPPRRQSRYQYRYALAQPAAEPDPAVESTVSRRTQMGIILMITRHECAPKLGWEIHQKGWGNTCFHQSTGGYVTKEKYEEPDNRLFFAC
jgi:hypothetical protein